MTKPSGESDIENVSELVDKIENDRKLSGVSYKDSFGEWMKGPSLQKAQEAVLSYLPFYPKSDGLRKAEIMKVDIGDKLWINEFCIENVKPSLSEESPGSNELVMLHGYGAALGFFVRNFDGLSAKPGSKIHALDILGYGMSARPKMKVSSVPTPPYKIYSRDDPEKKKPPVGIEDAVVEFQAKDFHKLREGTLKMVTEAEDFYIDSLEKWREARGIEKFNLLGHSMGGYLSVAYSLKYPSRVEKLILVSPVGVERNFLSVHSPYMKGEAAEAGSADSVIRFQPSADPANYNFIGRVLQMKGIFKFIWEKNISPFSVLKMTGPFGPKLVSNWSHYRFGRNLDEIKDLSEVKALHHYSYRLFVSKSSGEYGLFRFLAPGLIARNPLLDRVHALRVPTLWLYGDDDWMNVDAGRRAVKELNSREGVGIGRASFAIVSNAGHNLFLDNVQKFNDLVLRFLNWR